MPTRAPLTPCPQAGYCQPLLQRLLALVVSNLEVSPGGGGGYCQAAAAAAVRLLCEECGSFMGSCLQVGGWEVRTRSYEAEQPAHALHAR